MRSKNREVVVYKNPNIGQLPNYLALAQRHFEKDKPVCGEGGDITLQVPVDLVRMTIGDELARDIEEVTMTYRDGGWGGNA